MNRADVRLMQHLDVMLQRKWTNVKNSMHVILDKHFDAARTKANSPINTMIRELPIPRYSRCVALM